MKQLVEFLINSKSTGIIKVNDEFVDLGLDVLWCKYNLGVKNEIDFGEYYIWGCTEPIKGNKGCSESNLPYANGSIKRILDSNDDLLPKYDVVTNFYNGNYKYHLPTYDQANTLINNTDNEFIEHYNDSITSVYKFTNKKDSDKYIVIPFAGYKGDLGLDQTNIFGHYYTSTWAGSKSTAYGFHFGEKTLGVIASYRRNGFTVRAVKE